MNGISKDPAWTPWSVPPTMRPAASRTKETEPAPSEPKKSSSEPSPGGTMVPGAFDQSTEKATSLPLAAAERRASPATADGIPENSIAGV